MSGVIQKQEKKEMFTQKMFTKHMCLPTYIGKMIVLKTDQSVNLVSLDIGSNILFFRERISDIIYNNFALIILVTFVAVFTIFIRIKLGPIKNCIKGSQ